MTKRFLVSSLSSKAVMLVISGVMVWFALTIIPGNLAAQPEKAEVAAQTAAPTEAHALGMKYLSAALAVGIGSVAAGIAVAMVGAAAMGAVAERPELMGRSLIYVGLAEGIAIYGVVVAIMILMG
jgi:V/A-type H+-transporting ATPase subunit K